MVFQRFISLHAKTIKFGEVVVDSLISQTVDVDKHLRNKNVPKC